MKMFLLMLVGSSLIAASSLAMSSDKESFQQRCEEQAIEDAVEPANHADYMSDCIRYYQDMELPEQNESTDSAEEPEGASSEQS